MEREHDTLDCDDKQRRMVASARRQRMTTVKDEDEHYDDVAKAREEVE